VTCTANRGIERVRKGSKGATFVAAFSTSLGSGEDFPKLLSKRVKSEKGQMWGNCIYRKVGHM